MSVKILVVDDELSIKKLIRATIEGENYTIYEAGDGIEALYSVKTLQPDLIILDVMMPGMSGYEVCKTVKSDPQISKTKILLLTAKGQKSDRKEAQKIGADYFLAKPFSPFELLRIVNEIFAI